mmetsp:Transcript_78836/g.124477  ORF Transcript_78836/g.124477 Transcript_78836/m.124477 type:complete len:82 (-) Transcript_78836:37-282(-)
MQAAEEDDYPPRKQRSCISNKKNKDGANNEETRYDANGNAITGRKEHTITFCDEARGEDLHQVKEVAPVKNNNGGGCCSIQ